MKRIDTKENKVRIAYEYSPGSYAYIVNKDLQRKLKAPNEGPYEVLEVFTNGTVKLQRGPVAEIFNIRRLTPIKEVSSNEDQLLQRDRFTSSIQKANDLI